MPFEDQPTITEPVKPVHYPEVIALDGLEAAAEHADKKNLLATPESYLELEHEASEIQQALALDFDIWASDLSDDELRKRAEPSLAALNENRPGDPVVPETTNRRFLQHLIRPKWHEHFPKDESQAETDKWHGFVSQWPEHLQANLEELAEVDKDLRGLAGDKELMQGVAEIRSERVEVMRAASDYLGAGRTLDKLSAQSVAIHTQAALSNRSLTKRERAKIAAIGEHQAEARERQNKAISSEAVSEEITKRRALQDARDLRRGLLLTEQMKDTIDYILPSLLAGKPVLLVGETGGAKTAIAEFVAREYVLAGKAKPGEAPLEPEIISGHAEVNSYQLVGKMSIKDGDTQFDPGPMLRAMEEGKPLILDEINAMPPDFLKRLNKVMQLRPGDTYVPQEDSGRSVRISPGFCIIGTANEKSKRYKGVDDLSVEFQNRFGANVVRIGYPDDQVPDGQPPKDNLRLAMAFLRDRSGELDPQVEANLPDIFRLVRAAHVTQKLFTGSEVPDYVDPDTVRDGLKEAVIAPRTLIDILQKVKEGHELPVILSHFVAGFKNKSDQRALQTILEHHNLMPDSRRPS